jgi:hypothetical protein
MTKMTGSLPVKTRLPFSAWILAALVTVYSLATSLMEWIASGDVEQVQHAGVTNLLEFLHAL